MWFAKIENSAPVGSPFAAVQGTAFYYLRSLALRVSKQVGVFLTLLLLSSLSNAGVVPIDQKAKALGFFTLTNNSGAAATDFHMEIVSVPDANGIVENLTLGSIDGGNFRDHPNSGNNSGRITIDFSRGTVAEGAPNRFLLTLLQKLNTVRIDKAYWTPAGLGRGNVGVPGFSLVGDPTYTIFNDFDFSIGISGLEFLNDVPEIDPSLLLPGAMDGFSLTQPDFVLAAHSSMAFDIPGAIAPGNFLYAQGHLFDPVSGDELGAFIHGHQQPIPEPSVFGLLGIGLLILMSSSGKRRRSR